MRFVLLFLLITLCQQGMAQNNEPRLTFGTINAQGHQETWHLSIPRYAMLHAVYRLQVRPKGKQ